MGAYRHHAIIISTAVKDIRGSGRHWIEPVHHKAVEIFGAQNVTEVRPSEWNDLRTFMVIPDGSKLEWDESKEAIRRRDEFVKWLQENHLYDELPAPVKWVEVFYGDDYGPPTAAVVRDG